MAKKVYTIWLCDKCDTIIEYNPKKPKAPKCPECSGIMKKENNVTLGL